MFLLDTNVASELRNGRSGRADRNVAAWMRHVRSASLYLSVIVVHELEVGTLLDERRDPARQESAFANNQGYCRQCSTASIVAELATFASAGGR
ncbi:MAG: hypothetical protein ACREE5_16130 [Acetobacteraceae bacterium]